MSILTDPQKISEALAAPFTGEDIKFKPGAKAGDKAMVIWYVDARSIQQRLDDVVGCHNWRCEFVEMKAGILCRLSLRIGGEWITKEDAGGESEQPDEGDRLKAAASDAIKRAAVQWGMGRYLYRLPRQWAKFDGKKFETQPRLPGSQGGQAQRQEPQQRQLEDDSGTQPKQEAKQAGNGAVEPVDQSLIKSWTEYVSSKPELQHFNDQLKLLKHMDKATKKVVWDMVEKHAKERGWVFDKQVVLFVPKGTERTMQA